MLNGNHEFLPCSAISSTDTFEKKTMDFVQHMPKLTQAEFLEISRHMGQEFGINLSQAKLNLVENRLTKRLSLLKLKSFAEYVSFIFGKSGKKELDLLSDLLSTNMTYFYREAMHFNFLQALLEGASQGQSYSIWSAACSGGDEAYTIACVMEGAAQQKGIRYQILGTDISSRMITEATLASYPASRVESMPSYLLLNHFNKTSEKGNTWYTPKENLRQNVRFQQFNLTRDIPSLHQSFDVIFCRNVLIYFKEEMKHTVIQQMIRKLKPGGYLILGHCEGLLGKDSGLDYVKPSIYQKTLSPL